MIQPRAPRCLWYQPLYTTFSMLAETLPYGAGAGSVRYAGWQVVCGLRSGRVSGCCPLVWYASRVGVANEAGAVAIYRLIGPYIHYLALVFLRILKLLSLIIHTVAWYHMYERYQPFLLLFLNLFFEKEFPFTMETQMTKHLFTQ